MSLALILRPYIPRAQYPGSLDLMAAAPDATLVAGLDNQQRLCVWDPATEGENPATLRQALGPAYIYRCLVLSPDLKAALVVGGPASLRDLAASGTARADQFPLLAEGSAQLWDLASRKARWTKDFQVLLTGSGPSGIFSPVFSRGRQDFRRGMRRRCASVGGRDGRGTAHFRHEGTAGKRYRVFPGQPVSGGRQWTGGFHLGSFEPCPRAAVRGDVCGVLS